MPVRPDLPDADRRRPPDELFPPTGSLGEGAAEGSGPARRPVGFRGSYGWSLVRAVRPRQWVKNALVLAAPLAAGQVFEADVLGPSVIAFLLFCLASSGGNLATKAMTAERARRPPANRCRPIPPGIGPRPAPAALAAALIPAS